MNEIDVLYMLNKKVDDFANRVNKCVESGYSYFHVSIVICTWYGGHHILMIVSIVDKYNMMIITTIHYFSIKT